MTGSEVGEREGGGGGGGGHLIRCRIYYINF